MTDADGFQILWVLDDGVGFDPDCDLLTTEAILQAAQRDPRFRQSVTTISRIATVNDRVSASCVPDDPAHIESMPLSMSGAMHREIEAFDVVFLRVDPPISEPVRHAFLQLARVERRGKVLFVNSPTAILSRGSKLFNLEYPSLIAPGVVSADPELLQSHARNEGGLWVAKPLDRAGGVGVELLSAGGAELSDRLRNLTREYGQIHLQRFLPDVTTQGELRHLVFCGRVIAAWRKVPPPGDFRTNLDQGATIAGIPVGERFTGVDALVRRIGQDEPGFRFYSIDTIGGRVNELNVENVGGLPAADVLYGCEHARLILDRLGQVLDPTRLVANA